VAPFRGVRFDGVELPQLSLYAMPPDGLELFWDAGPDWAAAETIAAFFGLLAELERECAVRLGFEDPPYGVPVGAEFGRIFAAWHGRA
jgi:hypothetical protein